jgi:hypothetical protein
MEKTGAGVAHSSDRRRYPRDPTQAGWLSVTAHANLLQWYQLSKLRHGDLRASRKLDQSADSAG